VWAHIAPAKLSSTVFLKINGRDTTDTLERFYEITSAFKPGRQYRIRNF
jgi:hypothetical protein